jgi:citrate synthase
MRSTSSTPRPSPRGPSRGPGRTCIRHHGGIGALRGPKHGGANEVAFEIQSRYADPDDAEAEDIRARVAEKQVIIGFGHPVYTIADPRNVVIKRVAASCRRGRRHAACSTLPNGSRR